MKYLIKSIFAIASGCTIALAAGSAYAADINVHTFKLAFQNMDGSAQYAGAKKFSELVEQKSGGKMHVKMYPGGSLGKDTAVVSSMQGGIVDMAILSTTLLVGVTKEVGLLDLPFVFSSEKEALKVLDGPFGKKLHGLMQPKGLVGLAYFDLGFYHMHGNTRPINKLEDFSGLKLRVVETPVSIELMNTLGGNAVPIPFPELYTALEQKTVDGAGQPLINLVNAKFYEVQKYLSLTGHQYAPQSLLMSKKSMDKLTGDEKKVIQDAAQEAAAYQQGVSFQKAAESLALLKTKMQVNEISPAEINRMREKVKPMNEKFAKQIGESLATEMYAEIAKVRAAK